MGLVGTLEFLSWLPNQLWDLLHATGLSLAWSCHSNWVFKIIRQILNSHIVFEVILDKTGSLSVLALVSGGSSHRTGSSLIFVWEQLWPWSHHHWVHGILLGVDLRSLLWVFCFWGSVHAAGWPGTPEPLTCTASVLAQAHVRPPASPMFSFLQVDGYPQTHVASWEHAFLGALREHLVSLRKETEPCVGSRICKNAN